MSSAKRHALSVPYYNARGDELNIECTVAKIYNHMIRNTSNSKFSN